MSAWRRDAMQAFPMLRSVIQQAKSPAELWQFLRVQVCGRELNAAHSSPSRDMILQYARHCLFSSSSDVCHEATAFLRDVMPKAGKSAHLIFRESEWPLLASLLAEALPSQALNEFRELFFVGVSQLDDGSGAAVLRKIKDRIIQSSPREDLPKIESVWRRLLSVAEAGERALALEILVENLSEENISLGPTIVHDLCNLAVHWEAPIASRILNETYGQTGPNKS